MRMGGVSRTASASRSRPCGPSARSGRGTCRSPPRLGADRVRPGRRPGGVAGIMCAPAEGRGAGPGGRQHGVHRQRRRHPLGPRVSWRCCPAGCGPRPRSRTSTSWYISEPAAGRGASCATGQADLVALGRPLLDDPHSAGCSSASSGATGAEDDLVGSEPVAAVRRT